MAKSKSPARTNSTPAAPATLVLQVVAQPAKPYRATSARGQYWAVVTANHGQPAAAVAAALTATGAKTSAATSAWLAWFAKQGLITLVPQAS